MNLKSMLSKMSMLIQATILIILSFISHEHALAATLVGSVHKHTDGAKPLYSTYAFFNVSPELGGSSAPPYVMESLPKEEQNLIIDLDAPITWHYSFPRQESCRACPIPVACCESICSDMRTISSYLKPSCPPPTNSSIYESYGNCETCPVNVINPVTESCIQVMPTYDQIMFTYSNGGKFDTSYARYTTYPIAGSTAPSVFQPFPGDVMGVLALSPSAYALPAYLHDDVKKIVALCLPRSSDGVLFFGDGPYYLPAKSDVDARSFLSYIALVKLPNSSGYFIGVNDIVIKNRPIGLPANTTTKISTVVHYTTLRTDIYNPMVRRFTKVTKRIPHAMPVAPFGLCFNTSVNGTNVDIQVPNIDLMLPNGKKWTISATNSIKQVTTDVACLAFVDGGSTSEHGIVVGTYQLEDNFLSFNLENSTFGFSNSLLRRKLSCSVGVGEGPPSPPNSNWNGPPGPPDYGGGSPPPPSYYGGGAPAPPAYYPPCSKGAYLNWQDPPPSDYSDYSDWTGPPGPPNSNWQGPPPPSSNWQGPPPPYSN